MLSATACPETSYDLWNISMESTAKSLQVILKILEFLIKCSRLISRGVENWVTSMANS